MTWIDEITVFASLFQNVACVGLDKIAQRLVDEGSNPSVLGLDESFEFIPGYRAWNLHRPVYIEPQFDVVIADVREIGVPQAFESIRILSHFNFETPIVLVHEAERAAAFSRIFEPFNLVPNTIELDDLSFPGAVVTTNWDFS